MKRIKVPVIVFAGIYFICTSIAYGGELKNQWASDGYNWFNYKGNIIVFVDSKAKNICYSSPVYKIIDSKVTYPKTNNYKGNVTVTVKDKSLGKAYPIESFKKDKDGKITGYKKLPLRYAAYPKKGVQKIIIRGVPKDEQGKTLGKGWKIIYTVDQRNMVDGSKRYGYMYYTLNRRFGYVFPHMVKKYEMKVKSGSYIKETVKKRGKRYYKIVAKNSGTYTVVFTNRKNKKKIKYKIFAVPWLAHRGYDYKVISNKKFKANKKENTKAAFNAAVNAGAFAIETDIRFTGDKNDKMGLDGQPVINKGKRVRVGIPVCVHDRNLKGTLTRSDYYINQHTYAEAKNVAPEITTLKEYLKICCGKKKTGKKKYNRIVPIIEIKTPTALTPLTKHETDEIVKVVKEAWDRPDIPVYFVGYNTDATGDAFKKSGLTLEEFRKRKVKAQTDTVNNLKESIKEYRLYAKTNTEEIIKMRIVSKKELMTEDRPVVYGSYKDALGLKTAPIWSDSAILKGNKFVGVLWNTQRTEARFYKVLTNDVNVRNNAARYTRASAQ